MTTQQSEEVGQLPASLLSDVVRSLRVARAFCAIEKERLAAARQQWEDEHHLQRVTVETAEKNVAVLEEQVRTLAVAAYAATGDKHPTPGVEVIISNEINFDDEGKVIAWLVSTKQHQYLSILKTPLREAIHAGLKVAGTTVTPEPTVRISRDLGRALGIQTTEAGK